MIRFIFKYSLIVLCCLASFTIAKASSSIQPASSFQIASLYHKMVGATPDFENWAKYTDEYKEAKYYDEEAVLNEQEIKLKELYYNIFADEMISIQTSIPINEYSEKQQKLFLPTISVETFFNYHAFGTSYAVIVPGLEKFGTLDIPLDDMKHILDVTGSNALLDLTLKPEIADNNEPMVVDGEDYWMILCKLAQIRIWDSNRQTVLWSYQADWYDNSNTQLLDLYAQ